MSQCPNVKNLAKLDTPVTDFPQLKVAIMKQLPVLFLRVACTYDINKQCCQRRWIIVIKHLHILNACSRIADPAIIIANSPCCPSSNYNAGFATQTTNNIRSLAQTVMVSCNWCCRRPEYDISNYCKMGTIVLLTISNIQPCWKKGDGSIRSPECGSSPLSIEYMWFHKKPGTYLACQIKRSL